MLNIPAMLMLAASIKFVVEDAEIVYIVNGLNILAKLPLYQQPPPDLQNVRLKLLLLCIWSGPL